MLPWRILTHGVAIGCVLSGFVPHLLPFSQLDQVLDTTQPGSPKSRGIVIF
jgi:hypothetical protein